MADPTSLLQFAERELTERKAALLAANAEVTSRRTALLAADAALKTAAGDDAEANDKLAEVRRKLAAIEMPADGEPLLVELRTVIIDQRNTAAALAAADLAHAKAAGRHTAASRSAIARSLFHAQANLFPTLPRSRHSWKKPWCRPGRRSGSTQRSRSIRPAWSGAAC